IGSGRADRAPGDARAAALMSRPGSGRSREGPRTDRGGRVDREPERGPCGGRIGHSSCGGTPTRTGPLARGHQGSVTVPEHERVKCDWSGAKLAVQLSWPLASANRPVPPTTTDSPVTVPSVWFSCARMFRKIWSPLAVVTVAVPLKVEPLRTRLPA